MLKGVEGRAAAPLEPCHRSRAHKTDLGRIQGRSQAVVDRSKLVGLWSFFDKSTKVTHQGSRPNQLDESNA